MRAALVRCCVGWALLVAACSVGGWAAAQSAPLSLTWEPEGTVFVRDAKSGKSLAHTRAVVTLTNLDGAELPAQGWSIYANCMAGIDPEGAEGGLVVERTVGTQYRLRPGPGFTALAPGEERRFFLRHSEVVSRVDKGPVGPYFVPDASPGKGLPLAQFRAIAATRPAQVDRGAEEAVPWPSPEWLYRRYAHASEIDESKLAPLFPTPRSFEAHPGTLSWNAMPDVIAHDGLEPEVELARSLLAGAFPAEPTAPLPSALRLDIGPIAGEASPEAYELAIDRVNGVSIRGASAVGVSRGLQSLRQLLAPGPGGRGISAPALFVRDAPRFEVRALMLDVARNFQDKEVVLRVLDLMARAKLNVLHLHLADDEGWRLEISGLPELTQAGARRAHDPDPLRALPAMYGSGPGADDPHGSGYWREGDYIDILRRAAALRIEVIPEIEMPGHARAAIVAMKARAARIRAAGGAGADDFSLVDPADRSVYKSPQLYSDDAMDPGLPSTYRFIEHVVTQLASLHRKAGLPLRTIHVGGDELAKGVWEGSPACRELMRRMGFTTREQVWNHFYGRVEAILRRQGLFASGWEELGAKPESSAPEARVVANPAFLGHGARLTVWNNLDENKDLANRLANAGYGVVLAPVTNLYLDLAASRDPAEHGHDWAGFVDLRDTYDIRPFDILRLRPEEKAAGVPMEALTVAGQHNILGLEATLFSETLREPARIEYMLLPRLYALAERAWVQEPAWERSDDAEARLRHDADWSRFTNQLARRVLPRLDAGTPGVSYRIAPPGLLREGDTVRVNSELPGMALRYTTDDSEPTAASPLVQGALGERAILRVAAFDHNGRSGRSSVVDNR